MPDKQNQPQNENKGALADNWRETDRTDYFNTAGDEDMTVWDAMVNALKPDLSNKGR